MWEFYGIMTATNQAGLRNVNPSSGQYEGSDGESVLSTPLRTNVPLDLETV
jgi:hypothetical protein